MHYEFNTAVKTSEEHKKPNNRCSLNLYICVRAWFLLVHMPLVWKTEKVLESDHFIEKNSVYFAAGKTETIY